MTLSEIETADFLIPLGRPDVDPVAVFASVEFLDQNTPASEKVAKPTAEDKEWVSTQLTTQTPDLASAPSLPAYRRLKRHMDQYDFVVPGNQDQWQSYVMSKYFELTLEEDPKIVKSALDSLAKTSIVGLAVEKTEININTLPTQELESELLQALKKYSSEKVINGEATLA